MIEIEEDYVSFETAKLLKEKGFDAYIHLQYDENGEMFHKFHYEIKTNWRIRHGQEVYQCPTIQMAMKWLREVYKLSVRPRYDEPVMVNGRPYTDSEFGHHYACHKFGTIPANDKEEVFARLKEWLNG